MNGEKHLKIKQHISKQCITQRQNFRNSELNENKYIIYKNLWVFLSNTKKISSVKILILEEKFSN
jgi:hypothetical protein